MILLSECDPHSVGDRATGLQAASASRCCPRLGKVCLWGVRVAVLPECAQLFPERFTGSSQEVFELDRVIHSEPNPRGLLWQWGQDVPLS